LQIHWEVVISVLVTLVLAVQTALWRRLDKMDKRIDGKLDKIECEKQIINCEKLWCSRVQKDLDVLHARIMEMKEESTVARNELREYIKDMHEGLVENIEQLWHAHRNHSHTNMPSDTRVIVSRLE